MLGALIQLALNQRVVVLGAAVPLLLAGLYSFHELDIEAYPDPVQPVVIDALFLLLVTVLLTLTGTLAPHGATP